MPPQTKTPSAPAQATLGRFLGELPPGQTLWMEVKGNSMVPALLPSDRVEVEKIEAADLRVGDVAILDTKEAGWVIHRFFARGRGSPSALCTKGDASPRFDPAWPGARLIGRVRAVERGGRRFTCRRAWLLLGAARSLLVWCRGRLDGRRRDGSGAP